MSLKELGLERRTFGDTLVATIRANIKGREELYAIIKRLTQEIPQEYVAGPAFCIYWFISSVKEGFDVEVGVPLTRTINSGEVKTRLLAGMEVLSLIHKGPREELRESYGRLYSYAAEHALISDEFSREVYLDAGDLEGGRVELQFVLHNWSTLLNQSLERVLGKDAKRSVMQGSENLDIESTSDARFEWVKTAIKRLDKLATEDQRYEILSRCAHVFPQEPIEKLETVYKDARDQGQDPWSAIDAVLNFMDRDPAWIRRPVRKENVIYATKNPRDANGYAEAKTEAEKRRAYCFCPLVRDHLEDGEMSCTFCYCSAGWERQQWEGAIGQPVRVEIVKSLLRGDDCCQFAIYLPDDL
jgi:effector-binding domain-containing protein